MVSNAMQHAAVFACPSLHKKRFATAIIGAAILAIPAFAHAAAPAARSGSTTGITSTSAAVDGYVDANSTSTTAFFDLGRSTSFGTTVAAAPGTLTGANEARVTGTLSNLQCGTTYMWRMHARNASGESKGALRSFTTAACGTTTEPPPPPPPPPPTTSSKPVVQTTAASNVGQTSATLNANVTSGSALATTGFQWGKTTTYGASGSGSPSSLAASGTAAKVSMNVSGLTCGTVYHYQAAAQSSMGTTMGADQSFTTAACSTTPPPTTTTPPTVSTGSAGNVAATGATLNGTVTAGSAAATATFQWGTSTSYGQSASASPSSVAANGSSSVNASLTGLTCNTTYQYRVQATSSVGTANGANGSFTTAACGSTTPPPSGSASVRVSVGGFGYVKSDVGGISCGSVPAGATGTSSKCFVDSISGNVTLTATPFNSSFVFSGWSGDAGCAGNVCTVPASGAKWVRAKFVPASSSTNVCTAAGLVGDKANHPLNGNYPALTAGQSFTDPNFGTTIRKITDIQKDGRGGSAALPAYSTISAFNADESLLILYRVGTGHELYNGKTYQYIRNLSDLPMADIEQFYWDTTKPNIVYGVSSSQKTLYRYDVNAASGSRTTALKNFSTQCGTQSLSGGSDPFFNSWDSKVFGLACGVMFGYNQSTNSLGAIAPSSEPHASGGAPQASPSGRKLLVNQNSGGLRVYDFNMVRGPFLDQSSGFEHASQSMMSDGSDTYVAIQFDPGPSGTGVGSLVQWNIDGTPNGSNRIPGRVIVGPNTGYPYPPSGTHVGGTAFNRTGFVTVSINGNGTGNSLLDNELLYVDSDPATNPSGSACRIGHHRSASDSYWAEAHATISPSGTRVVFGSSWGNASGTAPVNAYVVELPGYRP